MSSIKCFATRKGGLRGLQCRGDVVGGVALVAVVE